jgi:hypothetical protein
MDWGVLQGRGFRVHGRILPPHIFIGSVSGSPAAEVLGNKFVTLGDPLFPMFIYTSVSQPPGSGINYTGPSSYKKRNYRTAVSQSLRTTDLHYLYTHLGLS